MIKNSMLLRHRERDGKILLAQRPDHADQAGFWGCRR